MRFRDLTGLTFGRLTVLERAANSPRGEARYLCRCECGELRTVWGQSLKRGHSRSCGCLSRESFAARLTTHGQRVRGKTTPTYMSWISMITRCTNPNSDNYPLYGRRGITVCENWQTFEGFYASMGQRPEGTTIDRIDPDGNYEPGNCRWLERGENTRRANLGRRKRRK